MSLLSEIKRAALEAPRMYFAPLTALPGVAHDLHAALAAAAREWRRCRWLRTTGGNPDDNPF